MKNLTQPQEKICPWMDGERYKVLRTIIIEVMVMNQNVSFYLKNTVFNNLLCLGGIFHPVRKFARQCYPQDKITVKWI